MSDSEWSTAPAQPADDQIAQCLKRVTRKGLSSGDFTIKKAREAAEQELGLDAGFFKQHETWKARSKEIVELVVEEDEPSPEKPKSVKPAAKAGGKRKSDEAPTQKTRPRKRARRSESEDELADEESETGPIRGDVDNDDMSEATPPKKAPTKRKPARKKAGNANDEKKEAKSKKKAPVKRKAPATKAAEKVVEDSEASDNDMQGHSPPVRKSEVENGGRAKSVKDESELSEEPEEEKAIAIGRPSVPEDDETDMSVLIDEPPKKKRGKKSTADAKSKATTTKSTSTKKAAGEEPTPEEEEVKRLQGWLVKCGIRKLWHRELADCNTSKAKIKHLKGMLEEAGMTGRYSNEKARDIKERRELAAELAATQEYAKKWGQDKHAGSGDESESGAQVSEEELKPATRKPKGLVDFGDSGDDGSD